MTVQVFSIGNNRDKVKKTLSMRERTRGRYLPKSIIDGSIPKDMGMEEDARCKDTC